MRFLRSASAVARVFTPWRSAPTAPSRSAWHSVIAFLAVALVLAGCGIRLAPNYDRDIIDGLARTNEDALTLFASVANGAPPGSYPRRVDAYNALQGKLESVGAMVKARGTPQPPATGVALLGVVGVQNAQQQADQYMQPSTGPNIEAMIRIVNLMRNDDSRGKLSALSVMTLKNNFSAEMNQALTYEKFLNR
jgi:hypothetical protein